MSGLRWRLARLIAPRPIMADPFPDEDGAMVVVRQDGTVAAFKAERFRMKATHRVRQYDFGTDLPPVYQPSRSFVRFVGTIGS